MGKDEQEWKSKLDEQIGTQSALITILNFVCDHNLNREGVKLVGVFISGMINDLESLWGNSLSDHQRGIIECFKRYQFRFSKFKPLSERDETATKQAYFVCIQCNTAVIPDVNHPLDVSCPQCHTNKWLEFAYKEIPNT